MQFFCVGSAESLACRGAGFTCAGFTGADKLGIGEGCGIVHSAAKAEDLSKRNGKWKQAPLRCLQEKIELRSPHDTEPDVVDAADVAGRAVVAPRRAAAVGAAAPAAAARQTVGTCRRSCGVCHAS